MTKEESVQDIKKKLSAVETNVSLLMPSAAVTNVKAAVHALHTALGNALAEHGEAIGLEASFVTAMHGTNKSV